VFLISFPSFHFLISRQSRRLSFTWNSDIRIEKKQIFFRNVLDLGLSYVFEGSIRTGSQYTNMGLLRHGFSVVGEGGVME
jgi:hypothetical protein